MKRTIKLLALAGTLAVFTTSALAQAKECNDEFKAATYQKWYDNRKDKQDVAYQAAKDYLATCTTEDQYSKALKNFVDAYDGLTAKTKINEEFKAAYEGKKWADQIRLGKQIVATDPENSAIYIVMGLAGLGDPSQLSEAAQFAKKAIEMIEAGKPFKPYETKDQPLAYLNYVVGKANVKSAPDEAIKSFLKAARYESDLKKDWRLYYDLADAYSEGPRAKLTEKYNGEVGPTKTETPESKLTLANLNQVIDRQIDALARAAALADATNKTAIMGELTDLYKYRNKSEAGLNELVAGVLSKPLPEVPTPLTSLPSTPSTTPATDSTGSAPPATTGGTKAAGNGATTTAVPNKTTTTTTTGAPAGTAKPTASPTPKKPRSNHRRG